jgi:hypothetical protein
MPEASEAASGYAICRQSHAGMAAPRSKVSLQIPNLQPTFANSTAAGGTMICTAASLHECCEFAGFFKAGEIMTPRSYAIHAGPAIVHILKDARPRRRQ